jgi:hypothetical protein
MTSKHVVDIFTKGCSQWLVADLLRQEKYCWLADTGWLMLICCERKILLVGDR